MPQTPFNTPLGAQVSAAITTNATTAINTGSAATLAGVIASSAGSAWTVQFYNGNPGSGGVALTPALAVVAGVTPLVYLRAPKGLYAVTAGTTPGSLTVAYYG